MQFRQTNKLIIEKDSEMRITATEGVRIGALAGIGWDSSFLPK